MDDRLDAATLAAIDHARLLVSMVHRDEAADHFSFDPPPPPDGVHLSLETVGANPEVVRHVVLHGRFSCATVLAAATTSTYVDQADVWDCTFGAIEGDPPGWQVRISTSDQAGWIERLYASVELAVAPGGDGVGAVGATVSLAATIAGPGAPDTALIGGVEVVPPLDLVGMVSPPQVEQVQVIRSADLELLAGIRLADPSLTAFGSPPGFAPVLDLQVDGMVLGFIVDAPELGPGEPVLSLFQLLRGVSLADHGQSLQLIVWREVSARWRRVRAGNWHPPDGAAAWERQARDLLARLGLVDFTTRDPKGYGAGTRRRRPLSAPAGSRWRNDSDGNGVLAAAGAWGTARVRRPTSAAAALRTAGRGHAPATTLLCAQEALVRANADNMPSVAAAAYAAMVDALLDLGRPTVADRARALAELA